MDLKREEALFEVGQGRKVIRGKDLSLNDREIDFHLVEPTGMNGRMHQDQASVSFPLAANSTLAAVGRSVVDDQKYPLRVAIPLVVQDLGHQPPKWPDPRLGLATTQHDAATYIPSGQILHCSLPFIFRLDAPGLSRLGGISA